MDAAGEVLCDDIWNECRKDAAVTADFPDWTLEEASSAQASSKKLRDSRISTAPWDNAQSMLLRAELMWERLWQLPERVIALSAHSCFLFFFVERLAAARG